MVSQLILPTPPEGVDHIITVLVSQIIKEQSWKSDVLFKESMPEKNLLFNITH